MDGLSWQGVLLWGFAGTLVLTTLMRASQSLGLTRMDIPFMLGTVVTPNRDLAKVVGFAMHFGNGWIFALVYALFVLVTLLPLLPGLHPRMVSEFAGPEPTRQLEPPGFMALNYGFRTPLATVVAHLVYGAILGSFYSPAP
ncbi:MAG TPA: hypothetical protein VIN09_05635 [Chloroflexota bacterium]